MKFAIAVLLGAMSVEAASLKQMHIHNLAEQKMNPHDLINDLDTDGSQTISWDEVKAFLNQMDIPQNHKDQALEHLRAEHNRADLNGDGEVDLRELKKLIEQ